MIENKEDIIQRLKAVRMLLQKKSGEFARGAGIDPRNYSSIESGNRAVGERVLSDICAAYGINTDWLLTGRGERFAEMPPPDPDEARQEFDRIPTVFLSDFAQNAQNTPKTPDTQDNAGACRPAGKDYHLVPVYNFDAVGSMHAGNDITDAPAFVERMIPFTGAADGDICVHVTGNSMIPTYSPGTLLLVRRVEGWRDYFGFGHCYVLFLNDGRRIIKEVQRYESAPREYVLCVSHNREFPAEELPKRMIVAVYKVIMTLTNEGF